MSLEQKASWMRGNSAFADSVIWKDEKEKKTGGRGFPWTIVGERFANEAGLSVGQKEPIEGKRARAWKFKRKVLVLGGKLPQMSNCRD